MFKTKKAQLFETKVKEGKAKTVSNAFVEAGIKKAVTTTTHNGAVAYSSTGKDFVDQFANLSVWKAPRDIHEIWKSQEILWNQDPTNCVKFTLFMRTITRKVAYWDGSFTEEVQRGSGLKHEAIARMLWLAVYHPDTFWANVELFIAAGSWKDIFKMMEMDLVYNGWDDKKLDFQAFANLIIVGLQNPNQSELIKKYLPSIDARSHCTTVEKQARTMIGKFLASEMMFTYEVYRKMKSSGKAHTWQKAISQNRMTEINFDSVHGRALMLLVNSKFLKNNNLKETYEKWIGKKKTVNFTGYAHELAKHISAYGNEKHVEDTLNAQFERLVEVAQQNINPNTGLICVVDTSGSMGGYASGTVMTARSVAQAMSVFFAKILKGPFANSWIEFNTSAKMHVYKTNTFVSMYREGMKSGYVGSTNFQSVIDLFVQIKKQGVTEENFPTGILCLSDGEFNPSQLGKTNVESALAKLKAAGFSKEYVENFKIILWNIPNNFYGKARVVFQTYGDVKNVFYLSGYDGSIVSFILEGKGYKSPDTAEALFEAAMDQELLNKVTIA